MVKRSWLFALLLAVPVIAFLVAGAVQGHMNSQLREVLRAEYPDADPVRVANATIEDLCADGSTGSLSTVCDTSASLSLMKSAALWSAGIAVALLMGIWLAGILARTNRSLLAYVFRPGLYLTVIVLVGLVITHAALAMATIYFGESALVNRIHAGLILAIGIGAALGVIAMVRSSFSLVRKAQVTVIGRSVDRAEAPELWRRVDDAAKRLGALGPQHIVLGLDANFFVTEAHVTCLSGQLEGRTLYCSMPLSRILTQAEFDSIVGHELAHFKGEDTKFSERFYPIYRGTALSLQSLQVVGSDGARAIPLLPAIATLSFFYESFAVAESRLSRDREFAADAAGASLTNASTLASALVKVHAFSGIWSGFDEAAAEALREGKVYTNASTLFASAVASSATPASLEGLAELHLPHPTDSHPPLGARLQALKHEIADVVPAALHVNPTTLALAIDGLEALEEEVSHAYQLILGRRLGIDLENAGSALASPDGA
jgi:Zn-dependent protease with chaperone function